MDIGLFFSLTEIFHEATHLGSSNQLLSAKYEKLKIERCFTNYEKLIKTYGWETMSTSYDSACPLVSHCSIKA